jgi:hypothetical protein
MQLPPLLHGQPTQAVDANCSTATYTALADFTLTAVPQSNWQALLNDTIEQSLSTLHDSASSAANCLETYWAYAARSQTPADASAMGTHEGQHCPGNVVDADPGGHDTVPQRTPAHGSDTAQTGQHSPCSKAPYMMHRPHQPAGHVPR